jgi:hypothetical protein
VYSFVEVCSCTQEALSLLAAVPGIHIIASIDHILSPLRKSSSQLLAMADSWLSVWDSRLMSRFKWLWHHTPTFAPYDVETRYDTPVVSQSRCSLGLPACCARRLSLSVPQLIAGERPDGDGGPARRRGAAEPDAQPPRHPLAARDAPGQAEGACERCARGEAAASLVVLLTPAVLLAACQACRSTRSWASARPRH